MSEKRRRAACAAGVFLALLGVYLLTSPGRIDTIDGQHRYDVSKNLIEAGEPTLTDPWLNFFVAWNERTGKRYATYNAGASVTPLPLMALSRLLPGHDAERDRFAFVLTPAFFGAMLGALLVVAYGMLGQGLGTSVAMAAVVCLATTWWPSSLTTLDQNQHAVFLLASLLLGWQSGRARSVGLAALAGLVGGLLFTYQENYGLLLPMVALSVFASPGEGSQPGRAAAAKPGRDAAVRYVVFGACCCVGLALFLAYNYWRFDAPFQPGRYSADSAPPELTARHPLAAFLSLLFSPGKGLFLFSPPLLLAFAGARGLFERAPALFGAIAATSLVHLLFIIQIPFFGGDWCWGPRYLLVLVPLWGLTFPFALARLARRRYVVTGLVAAGLAVQALGVSLDYHRFFFERNLPTYFWAGDEWVYFKHSQLLARIDEVATTLRDGIPPEAADLIPTPGGQVTYTTAGPPDPALSDAWARQFQIWYWPYAWPLWMHAADPAQRPVNLPAAILFCLAVLGAGCALVGAALRARPLAAVAPSPCRGAET
jgi:hypothetical protein